MSLTTSEETEHFIVQNMEIKNFQLYKNIHLGTFQHNG